MSGSTPALATLTIGATFHKRYQVVRCINAGSMGAVYEVFDQATDSPRALKVMLPSIVQDADLRSRFEREAKVTGGIESDHIVRVSDAGIDEDQGMPFLVMDLLRGDELGHLVKKRSNLSVAETIQFMSQMALALDKTHAKGIVHRDLKPENMFITQRDDGSPCLKILDFGISKVVADSNQAAKATRPMGTPIYMAPEQVRGDAQIGPAADIYALGHIAYTLLVGEPYWAEEGHRSALFTLMQQIVGGIQEAPSVRALRRNEVTLPPSFDAWMLKAVSHAPAARFPTASSAIEELRNVLGMRAATLSQLNLEAAPVTAQPSTIAMVGGGTAILVTPPAPSGATHASVTSTPPATSTGLASQTGPGVADTAPTLAGPAKPRTRAGIFVGIAVLTVGAGVAAVLLGGSNSHQPASTPPAVSDAGAQPTPTAVVSATPSTKQPEPPPPIDAIATPPASAVQAAPSTSVAPKYIFSAKPAGKPAPTGSQTKAPYERLL